MVHLVISAAACGAPDRWMHCFWTLAILSQYNNFSSQRGNQQIEEFIMNSNENMHYVYIGVRSVKTINKMDVILK
jgi:hypothetical protein